MARIRPQTLLLCGEEGKEIPIPLVDRAAFLAQIARPAGVTGLGTHDVRIQFVGEVAIIHARTKYTRADGQPGAGWYTDTWAKRDGRWLAVAAHVSRG